MDDRKKTIGMIVLCCLLFLFAGVRFWSMAADSRQQAELNNRSSPIKQRIVSKYEPHMMQKDPFEDLGLTSEQRSKIDEIMSSSMPKLPRPGAGDHPTRRNVLVTMGPGPVPPPGSGGILKRDTALPGDNGKPNVVRVTIPMDRIRAILTPEQRRKFDQMQ